MPIRIFETDEDAAPRERFENDVVGKFRSGFQKNGRPMSLEMWRVTTGDPEVATRIAELLDGKSPQKWETTAEDDLEVYTQASEVPVLLDADSVLASMALWTQGGSKPLRSCDGVSQTNGKPCECPLKLTERKEAAKEGIGCKPNIRITFKLAEAPELGKFQFRSTSWNLGGAIDKVEERVNALAAGDTLRAVLRLEVVEYVTKTGRDVRYTMPVVDLPKLATSRRTPR
jgi:hypothetical protein